MYAYEEVTVVTFSVQKAYFGCLAQDHTGLLRLRLVQFLPQQYLVVYYNTLPSLLHTATTYENPEKPGQKKKKNQMTPEQYRQKQVTLLFSGDGLAQSFFLFVSLFSF